MLSDCGLACGNALSSEGELIPFVRVGVALRGKMCRLLSKANDLNATALLKLIDAGLARLCRSSGGVCLFFCLSVYSVDLLSKQGGHLGGRNRSKAYLRVSGSCHIYIITSLSQSDLSNVKN